NRRVPPKNRMAATASARPPSTKAPTTAGLGAAIRALPGVLGPLARHERAHRRVAAPVAQRPGRAMGDRRARLGVQEDTVVADREQAGQLGAYHADGGAKA